MHQQIRRWGFPGLAALLLSATVLEAQSGNPYLEGLAVVTGFAALVIARFCAVPGNADVNRLPEEPLQVADVEQGHALDNDVSSGSDSEELASASEGDASISAYRP